MMIASILYHYLFINILFAIGLLSIKYMMDNKFLKRRKLISFKQQLNTNRSFLIYIPCIYCLVCLIKIFYLQNPTYIFYIPAITTKTLTQYTNVTHKQLSSNNIKDIVDNLLLDFILSAIIYKSIRYIQQLVKLKTLVKNSFVIRQHKNIHFIVSDKVHIPFCFSFIKKSYVAIPYQIIENNQHYQTAIRHELQHMRQKDTTWIYLVELFKTFFIINPLQLDVDFHLSAILLRYI